MIRHATVRTLFLSGVVVLAIIVTAFFALTHLTQAAPAHAAGLTTPAGQSNISQTLKLPHYSPKTLSCTRPVGQTCSIAIKNTTTTPQSVTLKGTVIYTLKPGQLQSISYKKAGTYIYGLKSNPKATLTVTVS